MKSIPVEQAVGLILCHDISEIVPGERKGVAFKRGHVVKEEDIERLLRLGKEQLFVWSEQTEGLIHEDDAAHRIAKAICGENITYGEPSEGRINLKSEINGLFEVDVNLLDSINDIADITVATIPTLMEVKAGQALAGTRVIPLCVAEESLLGLENICRQREAILRVSAFRHYKVGVITTGSEVFHGRIKDSFTPVLKNKFTAWGSEIVFHKTVPDQTEVTSAAIKEALSLGCEMIAVTGGMSVDPDDKTPAAIKEVSGEIVTYGTPVLPGAMFMLAYKGEIPIMGLPGCVMYCQASVFDLIVPRLLAGHRLTKQDFNRLGHGGFCVQCPKCHFPNCTFGR